MPTIYLLPTCKTCQRIHATVQESGEWEVRDIKSAPLSEAELDQLAERAGSYEALFSRRAILYRQRELGKQTLTEADYRRLILEHYTFLKRPILDVNGQLFIGSSKKVVEAAIAAR